MWSFPSSFVRKWRKIENQNFQEKVMMNSLKFKKLDSKKRISNDANQHHSTLINHNQHFIKLKIRIDSQTFFSLLDFKIIDERLFS